MRNVSPNYKDLNIFNTLKENYLKILDINLLRLKMLIAFVIYYIYNRLLYEQKI